MKKILSLLTLLVAVVTGAWAVDIVDTYTQFNTNFPTNGTGLTSGFTTVTAVENVTRNSSALAMLR
ncbi:MAG: hypothetical protein IJ155_00220 [Prevotella sp.]|nr:hypothetical protein [Prevotella sp.]